MYVCIHTHTQTHTQTHTHTHTHTYTHTHAHTRTHSDILSVKVYVRPIYTYIILLFRHIANMIVLYITLSVIFNVCYHSLTDLCIQVDRTSCMIRTEALNNDVTPATLIFMQNSENTQSIHTIDYCIIYIGLYKNFAGGLNKTWL